MKMQNPFSPRSICHQLVILFCVLGLLIPATALQAEDANNHAVTAPQADWLEPRGLSVVDLVGLVPEEHLRDTIVSWRVGTGILQYLSGERVGNTVTVNVRIGQRYWTNGSSWATLFGCLGKPAIADEWTVAMPPSTMRIFENGTDITSQVSAVLDYVPAGHVLPNSGGRDWWRYDFLWGQPVQFATDGSVQVPANMGCAYSVGGRRENLTARFVVETTNYITVEQLGSESFTFHSYAGAGNAGHFANLNGQIMRRYGTRHDKFDLHPPTGAEYALVKYPPTPVDPYMGQPEINAFMPASGSYRINGPGNILSVDHVSSMAMPLYAQWQDADQSGGEYLSFFNSPTRLASPEYFVPAGVAFDPCMINGGCSDALLEQVRNTEMTMTIYYYNISRTVEGLTKVPIKQVGPNWSAASAAGSMADPAAPTAIDQVSAAVRAAKPANSGITSKEAAVASAKQLDNPVYLPIVSTAPPPPAVLPDGDRTPCPCGWFDPYGRMFDYVPGP